MRACDDAYLSFRLDIYRSLKMQQRKSNPQKRQWSDLLFGALLVAATLLLLTLIERSLGLNSGWFAGANVVLAVFVFNIVCRPIRGRRKINSNS